MKNASIGKYYLYTKLEENLEYDEIIRITGDYENYLNINTNKYNVKTIYRVKALIFVGNFDEALRICYEALSTNALSEQNRNLIKYYIYCIYYFKEEHLKCIYYSEKLDIKYGGENNRKRLIRLIENLIYDGNPLFYDEHFSVAKENFMTHIIKRRNTDFNVDIEAFTDAIIDNFYKTRPYYINTTVVRIFRCFNAGKSESTGKLETCDYFIVHSKRDDKDTLVTSYFVPSPGSLEYCDITGDVYMKMEEKKNSSPVIRTRATEKFLRRQQKKKS